MFKSISVCGTIFYFFYGDVKERRVGTPVWRPLFFHKVESVGLPGMDLLNNWSIVWLIGIIEGCF